MHPLIAHGLKVLTASLGSIAVVLVLPIALLFVGFWLLAPDLCANSVLAESFAPNRRLKAVVFVRDCGATTRLSTQLSILDANRSLANDAGSVFIAECGPGNPSACPAGAPAIRAVWTSDKHLRIEHHPLIRIFKAEPNDDGTTVEYIPAAPDD